MNRTTFEPGPLAEVGCHADEDREWMPKVAAGWHLCLVVAEHLLDGHPIDPIRGEDARNYGWEELHDAYAKKLSN